MSTITKEQLRERAREKVKSLQFSVTQSAFAGSRAELEEELELARIALASLEAEPVYFVEIEGGQDINAGRIEGKNRPDLSLLPDGINQLYTAPPAPVSAPDAMEPTVEAIKRILPTSNPDDYAACIGADMWNACRAAMLQGADVSSPVIPDGWVLVPAEPTSEMYDAGDRQLATKQVWDAMIAAAPQQEVKS